jgi:hypothetical protein
MAYMFLHSPPMLAQLGLDLLFSSSFPRLDFHSKEKDLMAQKGMRNGIFFKFLRKVKQII